MFPPPTLVPLVLSKFLVEHVEGQPGLLILVVPCWMKAPWLPTVLNRHSLQCPIIKDLILDVLVGHVLKGCTEVCFVQQRFSSLGCQAMVGVTSASMSKVYQQC